jgi:hypothetical protein
MPPGLPPTSRRAMTEQPDARRHAALRNQTAPMSIRHERRRRLLADDSLDDDSPLPEESHLKLAGTGVEGGQAAYSANARADCQRLVLDVLPTRRLTVALTLLAACLAVGAVCLLHVAANWLKAYFEATDLAALDLDAPGNISHWLASTLWLLGALLAMLTYTLRRHRVDDYHGRYRVWLWTAAGCMLLSLFESAELGTFVRAAGRGVVAYFSLAEPLVWAGIVAVVFLSAGVRLALEMRKCRPAVGALAAAGCCFVIAALFRETRVIEISPANLPLASRGSWLIGYVLVLASFLLYARHVIAQIEGRAILAPAKPRRAKVRKIAKEAPDAAPSKVGLHVRTDLDPVEKSPAPSAPIPIRPAVNPRQATSDGQSASGLSRADRRRLRRDARMAG